MYQRDLGRLEREAHGLLLALVQRRVEELELVGGDRRRRSRRAEEHLVERQERLFGRFRLCISSGPRTLRCDGTYLAEARGHLFERVHCLFHPVGAQM